MAKGRRQKKYRPSWDLERDVRKRARDPGLLVVGVDEVGVGALAGPVMAAAVALSGGEPWLDGLDDSKRLTSKRREEMHAMIVGTALAFGVGYATHEEVDDVGIASARRLAVVRAFRDCKEALGCYAAAVVDDRRLAWIRSDLGGRASIFADKADQRSYSVAAASIVAKVVRDRHMRKMALMWPLYDFGRNVGYGTPRHLAALREHGPCPLHRRSFGPLKSMAEKAPARRAGARPAKV